MDALYWIDHLCLAVALVGGAICALTDLRTGYIYNKVTYPMATLGIILRGAQGIIAGDLRLAISGLVGFALGFVLGYILYAIGAWAGGDVKLLAAFGALIPSWKRLPSRWILLSAPYPIQASILLNSLLAVFPFMLAYVIYGMIRKRVLGRFAKRVLSSIPMLAQVSLLLLASSMLALLAFPESPLRRFLAFLIASLVLGALGRSIYVPVSLAISAYLATTRFEPRAVLEAYGIFLGSLLLVKVALDLVGFARRTVLQVEKRISDLAEGDIPAESIYLKDGVVVRETLDDALLRLRKAVRSGRIGEVLSALRIDADEVLADRSRAAGLTVEEIERLKELVREGRIEDRILVKKGMPFGPGLFLGLLLTIVYGDVFWKLLSITSPS